MKDSVTRAVKKKYPSIEVGGSKKSSSLKTNWHYKYADIGEDEYGGFANLEDMTLQELSDWVHKILEASRKSENPELYSGFKSDLKSELTRRYWKAKDKEDKGK